MNRKHFQGLPLLLWMIFFHQVRAQCGNHEPEQAVCVLPKEESLCRVGFLESCTSAVCYDSDALCKGLAPEELFFLGFCFALEASWPS